MTGISSEQLHIAYRAEGFSGKEDVDAFEAVLENDANWIQSHWREFGLNTGITHIAPHHEYRSKNVGIVHTVVAGSRDQQVMGFGNLIAMKNIFPNKVFGMYETRVYVRRGYWGNGVSRQLLSELYENVLTIHQNQLKSHKKPTLVLETVLVPDVGSYDKAKKSILESLYSLGARQILQWDPDFLVTILEP